MLVKPKRYSLSNSNIGCDELTTLFTTDIPLIDVRAPTEFIQGSLPGSVNLPILTNEERALIGTTYRYKGSEAAIQLGYKIVSKSVKQDRLQQWLNFIQQHPRAVLYCFRGGQRSQITQQWLKEAGVNRPLITGGYKQARQLLINVIEQFKENHSLLVITGPTGSGKTHLIRQMNNCYPIIDIEALARHRGSAFGSMSVPQPTQIDFENQLAVHLLKLEQDNASGPIIVEDESRHTGKVYLPSSFFAHMRNSEIIWVDEPLATRVDSLFEDYILATPIGQALQTRHSKQLLSSSAEIQETLYQRALLLFDQYANALQAISKKLGGVRFQEISQDLETAQSSFVNRNEIQANKIWIEKLVKYYYDPLYLGSLQRRQVNPCFKGSKQAVIDYLLTRKI
jgi:tRNA 2-selenouridine synthase